MFKGLWLNMPLILISFVTFSQVEKEIDPPFNIKTITFVQNNQNSIALFGLNDPFEIQFDDLYGNEANYYYEIVHCNYDWKHSDLTKNEYLQGFDGIRIQEYTNSLNALQLYSHYRIGFPNKNTQLLVSGNYMIKILNEDREVVFSRKLMIYENLVTVPMQIKRPRNINDVNYLNVVFRNDKDVDEDEPGEDFYLGVNFLTSGTNRIQIQLTHADAGYGNQVNTVTAAKISNVVGVATANIANVIGVS